MLNFKKLFVSYVGPTILIIVATIIQTSLISPFWGHGFNIIFSILLLLIFYNNINSLFLWLSLGGFITGIFAHNYLQFLFPLFLATLSVYLLFNKIFTKRSLYGLTLVFILGLLFYNLFSWLQIYCLYLFNLRDTVPLSIMIGNFFSQLGYNLFLVLSAVFIYVLFLPLLKYFKNYRY